MDKNLKDAPDNLNEAKDDVKEAITDHIDSAKAHVNAHMDQMTEKTKEIMVDVAHAIKKAAENVEDKLGKEESAPDKK